MGHALATLDGLDQETRTQIDTVLQDAKLWLQEQTTARQEMFTQLSKAVVEGNVQKARGLLTRVNAIAAHDRTDTETHSMRSHATTTLTCSPPSPSSAVNWSSQLPGAGASGARSSQKAALSAPAAANAAVVGQSGQRAELAGELVPRQNLATAGRELLRVELGHGPGAGAPVSQPQVPVTVDHCRRDRYGLGLIGGLPGDPARVGNAAQLGGGQPRGQVTGGLFGLLDRRQSECVVKYGQGWILAAL
ncbi:MULTISPECIES: hypothetical protein [unclassified Streptomyces]|uniref:hypothetical protein n=1 Tax=unclassified Streptomyces TaxID=2593676 RepID=UPI0015CF2CF8|nr:MULTISPECIES: hypothetical protein [unclassified Streptomyces]